MNLRLSRKQELYLIDLGLRKLLEAITEPASSKSTSNGNGETTGKKKQWSPAQRAKFKRTMKKVWAAKRAAQEE